MDERMTEEEKQRTIELISLDVKPEETSGALYFVVGEEGIQYNMLGAFDLEDLRMIKTILNSIMEIAIDREIEERINEGVAQFVSRSNN